MSEGLRLATTDPELRRRAIAILKKLRWLSDSPGASFVSVNSSGGKKEDKPPPGVPNRLDKSALDGDGLSLFEYHLQQIGTAANDYELRIRITWAEIDYHGAIRRQPSRQRATVGAPGADVEAEDHKRICDEYEGMDAVEAALRDGGDVSYVHYIHKARAANKRRVSDGLPMVEGWREWDEKRKRAEVKRLRDEGFTQVAVSDRLGVSTRTVKRYDKAA